MHLSVKRVWEDIKQARVRWWLRKARQSQASWIRKGISLEKDGRYREAIVCYDTVLSMDPEHPMAWSFKGSALLKLERYREARNAFQKFIDLAPPKYGKYVTEAKSIIRDIDEIVRAVTANAKTNKPLEDHRENL